MIKQEIIERLLPEKRETPAELEERYPARQLPEGAVVTRFAPSPTGFMHIGGLYSALISERLAHQSGGVFYLRIEDTDKKREVAGASGLITGSLAHYGIPVDEGETPEGDEAGAYGPYKQSARRNIYQSYVRDLLERGSAYPCFATAEELEKMRAIQEAGDERPGYYGRWAKWRDRSEEEVVAALDAGQPFVIRFRSEGDFNRRIQVKDLLLGSRDLNENDQDIVLLKSDGLPTYHLAHVVDDHLMRTTQVIRGNEWFPSLPLHLQLFAALGWSAPAYGHIFPIQKLEGASKRKLSKRKDPEADVSFYAQAGYPERAVIEYLLNLANSNFEDWRRDHPDQDNRAFPLTLKKLASSNGPLFDFDKLDSISREIISRYSAAEVYAQASRWAERFDPELFAKLAAEAEYACRILDIERGGALKVRKDIGKWSEVRREVEYFFDDWFCPTKAELAALLADLQAEDFEGIIARFEATYDEADDGPAWFDKLKAIARELGYAESAKELKAEPEKYRGSVADVAKLLRVLVTGRTQTPDLCSIMRVMGRERVLRRLDSWAE